MSSQTKAIKCIIALTPIYQIDWWGKGSTLILSLKAPSTGGNDIDGLAGLIDAKTIYTRTPNSIRIPDVVMTWMKLQILLTNQKASERGWSTNFPVWYGSCSNFQVYFNNISKGGSNWWDYTWESVLWAAIRLEVRTPLKCTWRNVDLFVKVIIVSTSNTFNVIAFSKTIFH